MNAAMEKIGQKWTACNFLGWNKLARHDKPTNQIMAFILWPRKQCWGEEILWHRKHRGFSVNKAKKRYGMEDGGDDFV